jgi:DNA-binding MarR family transcriptional regulator
MTARIEPDAHVAFLMVSMSNRISAAASQAYMRCFGVGLMEWRVLGLLPGRDGLAAKEIVQLSGLDKSAVSRAVASLVRGGYVASEADEKDHRSARLKLTKSGRELHDRVIVASLAREELLLHGFSDEEREAFFGFLRRAAANIPRVEAHDPCP